MIFRNGVYVHNLDEDLLTRLTLAEHLAEVEFEITSGFREESKGAHGRRLAVDIACTTSSKRWAIKSGLTEAGFTRIGLYNRHIHADRSEHRPSFVLWLGRSK